MKKTLIGGIAALALLAACGVDKEGTADNLIEELENSGLEFDDTQKECIKDAVTSYSDDELRDLSENEASAELTTDFQEKLAECVLPEG